MGGYHENIVTLEPNVPSDQAQRQTLGLRMVQDGVLSRQTFRDRYAGEMLPPDEQLRVDTERAMMSQELAPKVIIQTLRSRYPVDIEGKGSWLDIIQGTPLAKSAEQFGLAHAMPDGAMMEGPSMTPKPELPMSTVGQGVPMPAPGAIQPPAIVPPSGGGIPPQLQGQLTPEGMGLSNMPPELFAQLMGRPLPPGEELNRLGGG